MSCPVPAFSSAYDALMPGSNPATSQLDWLSSTTAMTVLFWSGRRGTAQVVRLGHRGTPSVDARRSCHPTARPIGSFSSARRWASVSYRSSPDPPPEGHGFEIPVPRERSGGLSLHPLIGPRLGSASLVSVHKLQVLESRQQSRFCRGKARRFRIGCGCQPLPKHNPNAEPTMRQERTVQATIFEVFVRHPS